MCRLILILLVIVGCSAPQQDPVDILILYTDDQRFNTIGALGNEEIRTPNIDALVRRGITFTHAHTMGGLHGALCAPSRAMLMTGRPLFRLDRTGDNIPPEHTMMPEAATKAGYITFGTGKWHNDRASFARAFQTADNIFLGGMHLPAVGGHEAPELYEFDSTGTYPNHERRQTQGYSSTLFANAAIDFLNEASTMDQPFFAYVSFTSPHDPRTPPEPYASWYHPDSISLPPNFLPAHPFDNGHLDVRDELLREVPRTEAMVREELALYYGMISELDAEVGRIISALEENGQLDNTLIVLAGDNGLAVGSHGLLGKQNLYDHSMRVPLIMAGPGIPANEQRSQLVYIFDIFPTIAEILNLPLSQTIEGQNLNPFIENPQLPGRNSVFYVYRDLQRGIRTADGWKHIQYLVNGVYTEQLFDLNSDPYETNNLSSDSSHVTKLDELRELLIQESVFWSDPLDLSAPDWGR
ncbi:MAG: sulfatase-like hydrolase/transferase [Bacteroidetes bacterium]|nr:sulfatase-like hydrolase/transferase [Bacteroidota bacterium]MCY4205639.1 sulfatase-like hydrolase/transferase [Bacteroidota bacterium]